MASVPVNPDTVRATLGIHVSRMETFWTSKHSVYRDGRPLRAETVEGHARRLGQFVTFCITQGYLADPLILACNQHIVKEWLDALSAKNISAGTRARCIDGLLSLLRSVFCGPCETPFGHQSMEALRKFRNSLQATYEAELMGRSDRISLNKAGRWCDWDDIIVATKNCQQSFHQLNTRWKESRRGVDVDYQPVDETATLQRKAGLACLKAFVACLYVGIPPGRGLEYHSLQIDYTNLKREPEEDENLLAAVEGSWFLRLSRYKTSAKNGRVEIALPQQMFPIINAWVNTFRASLLCGVKHNFCFLNAVSGQPFKNSSEWYRLLTSIFEDNLPLSDTQPPPKVSVNILRKSFLTKVFPTATLEERESNAHAMRHSVTVAAKSYCATTAADKSKVAVIRCANALFEDTTETATEGGGAATEPKMTTDDKVTMDHTVTTEPEETTETEVTTDHKVTSDTKVTTDTKVATDEFEVERVLKTRTLRDGSVQYLVHFVGFDQDEDQWVDEDDISPACVRGFFQARPTAGASSTKRSRR
jgi:hypothetical protein